MSAVYACCTDEHRRNAVRSPASTVNGIDFLEVLPDQRTLHVHFLKPIAIPLDETNVRVIGGEREGQIDPDVDQATTSGSVLTVDLAVAGDFSPYVLRLVGGTLSDEPPAGIDPRLAQIDFSFKVNCDTGFDCKPERDCPIEPFTEPEIDYLAKDYASFRRLMLDRLAVLLPSWRSRNAADLGIALVELLAYVGDQLSYFQDAVATEAYLGTARRRVSVRRHARLVDYRMHDGCNARVWVHFGLREAGGGVDPGIPLPVKTPLVTSTPGVDTVVSDDRYRRLLGGAFEVFETMHPARLFSAHNRMSFYTWGARECCLPMRATSATLRGSFPNLRRGDVVIFEELVGPETGAAADADPSHRHAVRLTRVASSSDPIGGLFDDPPVAAPVAVTEIEWHAEDALPFPLCISSTARDGSYLEEVSCALGNVVLADHGRTARIGPDDLEPLGAVPESSIFLAPEAGDRCDRRPRRPLPPRFRPTLVERPLTHAAPDPFEHERDSLRSAAAALRWDAPDAVPSVQLESAVGRNGRHATWFAFRDLLDAGPGATRFVVEVESDGAASVRFGDDRFGLRPASGTVFHAEYRVGNGVRGNIGARSIAHVVTDDVVEIRRVTNPLPAAGGADPETLEHARQSAPSAFRTQERAVTLEDYGEVARRDVGVQRAAATSRWTGSWRTVFVSVDRLGGASLEEDFRRDLGIHLDRYRMAGQDVDVDVPRFVSLELDLFVCVDDAYFRRDVERALRAEFSRGTLPDGRRGLFHPDRFTFGQAVHLSALLAAAQALPGVEAVEVRRFRRQGDPASDSASTGILVLGRLEVARLDQDPDFPEHGKLTLALGGGK